MKRRPNTQCRVCGGSIYRRPIEISTGNVYCSRTCSGLGQRVAHTCRMCGKSYLGAKKTCSRSCANKARAGIKYTGLNPSNRAARSTELKMKLALERGGLCERCGEENYSILQVHHVHEKHRGGGDHLSNLELLCPNCHATHHLGKSLFASEENAKVHR